MNGESKNLEGFMLSITDKSGKIIHVNKKFCDVSKYSENEILGNTHRIVKSGHHPESFYKNLWMTISKGKLFSCLIKNKAKDGTTYWLKSTMFPILDENSNPNQYVCVSHTVSISKEKNNVRLKFTADIRHALDEASIVAITDNKGTITYVNDMFCKLSKYSEEELLGKNHRILKSGYHSAEFYSKLWKTISSGKTWRGDIKNKAKDGIFYWVRTTIIPSFDKNQNIQNYISIRTDITSQVRLSEKLVKAERLVSIGALASRMAHDIRNPLSVISAGLEIIKSKTKDKIDEDTKKNFTRIDKAIARITHQIEEVLCYVGERSLEKSSINSLENIITSSLGSVVIPDSVKTHLELEDILVYCDPVKMKSVFSNIILNSIQAMNDEGELYIGLHTNEMIKIEISDTGEGIPEKNFSKIFEPLYTTKQKGTGLGLTTCKSIVESHGGIISVKRNEDKGVTFILKFPKYIII